jgi:(S)-sulfolactate dehydrogenase
MQILITEFMDAAAVASLAAQHDTHLDATLVDRRADLLAAAATADALIVRNRTQVDRALLAAAPRLKVVGRLGVGLDNIDVTACAERAIVVIPATGANALAVAEYVIGCALMLLRGAYLSTGAVAQGQWPRTALSTGREAAGKTLGLIGFGGIGRLTAQLALLLGLRVVAHDPALADDDPCWDTEAVTPLPLAALLAESDCVSLHVPLTDATRNLLDRTRIDQMRRGSVLINTARGGIVDERALTDALRRGHLGGAAMDVFATEPLPADPHWQDVPNLILTPHIAGVTLESNVRVSSLIAERVLDALATGAGKS